MRLDQAKRLKPLEQENTRLKRLVASGAGQRHLEGGGVGKVLRPAPTTPSHGPRTAPAGRLRTAGLSSPGATAVDAPASTVRARRRVPLGRTVDRARDRVWAVWLSTYHGAPTGRRVASASQTRGTALATRGAESAAETAETGDGCGSPMARASAGGPSIATTCGPTTSWRNGHTMAGR